MHQFNLTEELKRAIGMHNPEMVDFVSISTHSLAWRMRIIFDTKLNPHELFTKDVRFHNPQWGDEEKFKAPIQSIEFFLPIKWKLVLSGMAQYNFFIEVIGNLTGGDKARIESFWLCGLLPDSSTVNTWNIGKGKIITNNAVLGQEYLGTASRGWKIGTPSKHPVSTILKID